MKELGRNFDLTGTAPSDVEKQEAFKACVDPAENARQIAGIGELLETDIKNAFETSKMPSDLALQTNEGRELAAALGPTVMFTQRDQFWAEQLADRYLCKFGDPIYYLKSKDAPMQVITASMTDGGPAMAVNSLQTMKGYDVPVPVSGQRLVLQFEFDDPRLAESNYTSRLKAIDMARYRIRKGMQDMLLTAWTGGFAASLAAATYHDLPAGRVHPTTNILDFKTTGKLDLANVTKFSDYCETFGFGGQKLLFVSPKHFNDIKTWVSTTTQTDSGTVFAKQIMSVGSSIDTIAVYDVLVVKKNNIPDIAAYGLILDDGVSKTLGIYQWGKIQTIPSIVNKPLRSAFDVYIPGIAAVNHDVVRVVKCEFA
jgi:hypothetical protein